MFTRLSHNLAARRPRLLLRALPYLLLTVAGKSLHNHSFGEQPNAAVASLVQSAADGLQVARRWRPSLECNAH
jgi:hypothetical protein